MGTDVVGEGRSWRGEEWRRRGACEDAAATGRRDGLQKWNGGAHVWGQCGGRGVRTTCFPRVVHAVHAGAVALAACKAREP